MRIISIVFLAVKNLRAMKLFMGQELIIFLGLNIF